MEGEIYFIKYDKNEVETSYNTSNLSYALNVKTKCDSILEIDNSSYNQYYKLNITSVNTVKAELYDDEMELLETYTGTNIQFYKPMLNSVYYLKLNYVNVGITGDININISAHNHTYTYTQNGSNHTARCTTCNYTTTFSHVYDEHYCIHCNAYTSAHDYDRNYEWVNNTTHSVECSCGAETTQGHAVSSDAFNNGQRYAAYLLCGGVAEIGLIEYTINSSEITQITSNGSFILPNGVIVLVNEDLEAYLNGTLIFYHKSDTSLIQLHIHN